MQGIDAARIGEPLTSGDSVLFGLHLLHGGDVRSWFVRVISLEDEDGIGDGLSLRVDVWDGSAMPIASETVAVTKHLTSGAMRGCVVASKSDEASAPDRSPPAARGFMFARSAKSRALFAVMDVIRIVEQADVLADILWQAVRRPGVLSLLGGVRITAGMSFAHAKAVIDPATRVAGFEFPLRLNVNKVPGLLCTVTVVDPFPPLRTCGGITRLVAYDPHDPTRRVVLRLLAARCAP